MRFPVAGLRQLIFSTIPLLSFIDIASGQDGQDVLFTSSVSYCAPPIALLVQQFDIKYFAANNSIFFNVSASSVDPNINATANLMLNVYGMQPVNITINLCDEFSGALCPLPKYNFNGSQIIPIPASVDVASHVPGIAYKIPDLEAFAQLTLLEVGTGEVKACVQSTLSNGWSTHQRGVEWATGGVAILAFCSAAFHSLRSPEALAPFRFIDLMSLYQVIGTSALLNLNYPVVYRSFASNFAWALGLLAVGARSNIQKAINGMRHHTGGRMADANAGSAIDLVNRRLSPYNSLNPILAASADATSFAKKLFIVGASGLPHHTKRGVVTVTSDSSNVLQAGVPVFVNMLGVGTANSFMTVFFSMLFLVIIAACVLGFGYVVLKIILQRRRTRGELSPTLEEWREYYPWFSKAWALRLCLISFLPITTFALFQWTLKDSWLSILLSVISLLTVSAYILFAIFRTIQVVRRERPWTLYTLTPHILSYGPLYIQFRHQRWNFFALPVGGIVVRAVIVAFAKSSGLAQVVLLLLLESVLLAATVIFKPHETRGGDALAVTLAVARLVAAGLLFAFVESFGVDPIPRVAIGIVLAILFSVMVLIMVVNTLINLGLVSAWKERMRWRLGTRLSSEKGSRDTSDIEKGEKYPDTNGSSSLTSHPELRLTNVPSSGSNASSGRPRNPTPLKNIPLDPDLNEPYPGVTPTTATTVSPLPSGFLRTPTSAPPTAESGASSFDSGLGEVLPRRDEYEGLGLDRMVVPSIIEEDSSSPRDNTGGGSSTEDDDIFVDVPNVPRSPTGPPSPLEQFTHGVL